MPQVRVETLDGGLNHVIIENDVSIPNADPEQSLSQFSKKLPQMLVNLLSLPTVSQKLIKHLGVLKDRSNIKVITQQQNVIDLCRRSGLAVFPSVKSAALSYAGDETLELLRRKLRDVPVLNTEAYKLIAATSSPDASLAMLESKIKDNPGLCSQIIRWANSATFARRAKAETLHQAMSILGMSNLRQLFIFNFYNSVGGLFSAQQELMDHGRKCAILAEFIAKAGGALSDECAKVRLGGLLHDIGRQALMFAFPERYQDVRQKIIEESKPSFIAELLVFGTEHQSIGSHLCNLWNFPEYLGAIVADHHYLKSAGWNALTLPIFCANNYLNEIGKMPFSPWFQKLEAYFFVKQKDMPWNDVMKVFGEYMATQEQEIFS